MITVPFSSVFLVKPRRSNALGLPPSTIQLMILPSSAFHVNVNPGVRVDQLDPSDSSGQLDWLVRVEFRRKTHGAPAQALRPEEDR